MPKREQNTVTSVLFCLLQINLFPPFVVLLGAQMAVERINQDFKILNHYTFELIVKDTQCQTALTLSAFIEFMSQSHNNTIAGILGPACSVQTEIIAEVAPLYNTIVMGYSVEGISLADREKYPLFFRTSPSKAEFKFAYSAVFEFFGWKQFASLTDTNYVSSTVTATHQHLATKGVSLVFAGQVTNQENVDIKSYLRSLQESSAKIIIATLFESLARAVVCQAYLQVWSFVNVGVKGEAMNQMKSWHLREAWYVLIVMSCCSTL